MYLVLLLQCLINDTQRFQNFSCFISMTGGDLLLFPNSYLPPVNVTTSIIFEICLKNMSSYKKTELATTLSTSFEPIHIGDDYFLCFYFQLCCYIKRKRRRRHLSNYSYGSFIAVVVFIYIPSLTGRCILSTRHTNQELKRNLVCGLISNNCALYFPL